MPKVRHGVVHASLSRRFGALLGSLVQLLEVLFGCWVQLGAKSFLSVDRARLALRNLVNFKSVCHGGVHHDLARSLNFLETVERDVVQVVGRVEVTFLVSHDLLEEVVAAGLSLLSLQQQIVSGGDLVVLIVLDVRHRLVEVAVIRGDARCVETVLDLAKKLFDHRHPVLANHDALHFRWLHLVVPLVVADVFHSEALGGIGVEDLLDEVL